MTKPKKPIAAQANTEALKSAQDAAVKTAKEAEKVGAPVPPKDVTNDGKSPADHENKTLSVAKTGGDPIGDQMNSGADARAAAGESYEGAAKRLEESYADSAKTFVPGNPIGQTLDWFVGVKQLAADVVVNERQTAFYTGMQLEELAEKLTLIFGSQHALVAKMVYFADKFKNGGLDSQTAVALQQNPKLFLDADLDNIWVSIGAAAAQGADVIGGYNAVSQANWDKRDPESGEFKLAEGTGKVLKPEGWKEADLTPYIHPSLNK